MNLDKSDLKILTAHELGVRLDDALESQTKDLYRYEGATAAYQKAVSTVDDLNKIVDQDMDAGLFDLEQAAKIKKFLLRASQALTNLSIQAANNRIAQTGRVAGLASAVEIAKKFKDEESKKAETLRLAVAQNKISREGEILAPDAPKVPGIRPELSIKQRRLMEAGETEGAVEEPAVEEPAIERPETEPSETASETIQVKRRGRPPKKK